MALKKIFWQFVFLYLLFKTNEYENPPQLRIYYILFFVISFLWVKSWKARKMYCINFGAVSLGIFYIPSVFFAEWVVPK